MRRRIVVMRMTGMMTKKIRWQRWRMGNHRHVNAGEEARGRQDSFSKEKV